jgi:Amt family ammonium transporter
MGVYGYPDFQIVTNELDYNSSDNAPIKQLARFKSSTEVIKSSPTTKPAVSVETAIPVEVVSKSAPAGASGTKMTKVAIIMNQSKFEALKEAMNKIGVTGMTVTNVLGCGMQKGKTEFYRGVEMSINLLPKVEVEIVVAKVPVRKVIETAKDALYTGQIGDGKIFVYDVENVIKVRTGEEGYDALQDEE